MGFSTALSYRPLYNSVIEPQWDMHHKAAGIDERLTTPNTALAPAAVKYYLSAHQTYADREALGLMKKDLDQFYDAAVRKR